jgi:hypothetical protein
MEYDKKKVDDMALALLHLTTYEDKAGYRAWKSLDWDTLERLHEQGYLGNVKSKARSMIVTAEGRKISEALFKKHFSMPD